MDNIETLPDPGAHSAVWQDYIEALLVHDKALEGFTNPSPQAFMRLGLECGFWVRAKASVEDSKSMVKTIQELNQIDHHIGTAMMGLLINLYGGVSEYEILESAGTYGWDLVDESLMSALSSFLSTLAKPWQDFKDIRPDMPIAIAERTKKGEALSMGKHGDVQLMAGRAVVELDRPELWAKGQEYWQTVLGKDFILRGTFFSESWPNDRAALLAEIYQGESVRARTIGTVEGVYEEIIEAFVSTTKHWTGYATADTCRAVIAIAKPEDFAPIERAMWCNPAWLWEVYTPEFMSSLDQSLYSEDLLWLEESTDVSTAARRAELLATLVIIKRGPEVCKQLGEIALHLTTEHLEAGIDKALERAPGERIRNCTTAQKAWLLNRAGFSGKRTLFAKLSPPAQAVGGGISL